MPPADLYTQYTVVGILVLVLALVFGAAWKVFGEYRKWQSLEQEKQRAWQEKMEKLRSTEQIERDNTWRSFFDQISRQSEVAARATNQVLERLAEKQDKVIELLTVHDAKVEGRLEQVVSRRRGS